LKRTATWMASAAVLAALVAGSATASAAPSASAKAKVTPAKVTQLTKLSRSDGQYISLAKRVKKCPASAPVLRSAAKQRAAALKKARRSSVKVLRAKNKRLSKAVVLLARFESGCARSGTSVIAPGASQSPPGSPPGSVSFGLSTPGVLNSPLVDQGSGLGGSPLPSTVGLVTLDGLTSPLCSVVNAACVGIDPNSLLASLTRLVTENPALAPIATPLLEQVQALLEAGNLDPLFEVRRISDTVIQLVPEGPLATLASLLGDVVAKVSDTVGRIQVV
jgi:hypothetical protein